MDKDRGHVWRKVDNKEGSAIDILAYEIDNHNGPMCINCFYSYCHHCEDGPQEDCKGKKKRITDGRHDISNKVLKNLEPTLKTQDHFGMDKYGRPLKSVYRYNWRKMGDEELADFLKYRVCEQERIELVEKTIRQAFESDDVFTKNALLLEALDLLAIEGTGK